LLPNHFEPLKVRRTNYDRPIGIIYNPNSGKKRDLRPLIEKRLSEHNIAYELLQTEKSFDTFRYAYNSDLSKFSALIAVGGDGSVSEVLNGMMARPDGQRVPLGAIPNGSGNQWCYTLGIESAEEALDTIIQAHVVKADTIRVLTDTENVESVPLGLDGYNRRRYALAGCVDGDFPKMVTDAIPLKPYFGNASYFVMMVKLLLIDGLQKRKYEIEVDGVRVSNTEDQQDSMISTCQLIGDSKF